MWDWLAYSSLYLCFLHPWRIPSSGDMTNFNQLWHLINAKTRTNEPTPAQSMELGRWAWQGELAGSKVAQHSDYHYLPPDDCKSTLMCRKHLPLHHHRTWNGEEHLQFGKQSQMASDSHIDFWIHKEKYSIPLQVFKCKFVPLKIGISTSLVRIGLAHLPAPQPPTIYEATNQFNNQRTIAPTLWNFQPKSFPQKTSFQQATN